MNQAIKKSLEKPYIIGVLLLRQTWIVNYYVKCSSDNLSNENKNSGVTSKPVHLGILIHVICLETFLLDY